MTILLLVISGLISLSIAYYQYLFKQNHKPRYVILLFGLKSLSLFLLFLLVINPEIKTRVTRNTKPKLYLLADNSKSIQFLQQQEQLQKDLGILLGDKSLQQKFDIRSFSFTDGIASTDSMVFTAESTDIFQSLSQVLDISDESHKNAVILLTDGNQTSGNSLEYIRSKIPVYPLIYGDTTKYPDLAIAQINTNKFSFLNNSFPGEFILTYSGNDKVNTTFRILKNGKIIFRKNVSFSASDKSQIISTNLKSDKIGIQYYKAELSVLQDEKNRTNNQKDFSIEVIDEQSKIALFSSIAHPDIGALKRAVESNKQRKLEILHPQKDKFRLDDYELLIMYQPTADFQSLMTSVLKESKNYILITGGATDWSFLNKNNLGIRKNALTQTEDYLPKYNSNFLDFYQEDIGFNEFPPLTDVFGRITTTKSFQPFIYQRINDIESEQHLVTVLNSENQKAIWVLGEGLWKWRSFYYRQKNTFEGFDRFVNTLVQFTIKKSEKNRLLLDYQRVYPANSNLLIKAIYLDETYKFDPRVSLELILKNKQTNESSSLPLSLKENRYEVEINELLAGDYGFNLKVSGTSISKSGSFKILDYSIEEQFTNANLEAMRSLAANSNGKVYFTNQVNELSRDLYNNNSLYTIQYDETITKRIIDWKWILFFVVGLLSLEWFIRKYFGKI